MLAEWWEDWSSVAGLAVGIIGFVITLILLFKSKSSVEAAKAAALDAANQMRRSISLTDVTATTRITREIIIHQRDKHWEVALLRYTELKTLLVRVREENPSLATKQKREIQDVIGQIRTLESAVEQVHLEPGTPHDVRRWNDILSRILETLDALTVSISLQGDTR